MGPVQKGRHYFNEEPPPVTPVVNKDYLSTSEKAFLNEIKSTYDLLYKDNGYLYFGTSINDYVAQAEADNYIKLKFFKDSFLSNLEEKKSYSIKELLE